MKAMKIFMLCAMTALARLASAQSPVRMEYFLDTDPGYGLARTITDISVGNNELIIDISDAPAGAHVLYVRSQDDKGRWSTTMARPFFINRLQDVVYIEYYLDDNDPGIGKATSITLPEQDYKAHLNFSFSPDTSTLGLGTHTLTVRALDAFGTWTDEMTRSFEIVEAGTPIDPIPENGDLSRLEYFFDKDPGYGLATPLAKPNTGRNTYQMSFEDVSDGAHLLCLRAQDENGHWSAVLSRPIYVVGSPLGITGIEYFFDTNDPGEGKAVQVEAKGGSCGTYAFDVPTENLTVGEHQLNVRIRLTDGTWTLCSSEPFIIESATDIQTVQWTMPLNMRLTLSSCILTAEKSMERGDCRVEVYDIAGRLLASGIWSSSISLYRLPLSLSRNSIAVVRVTDTVQNRISIKCLLVEP